MSASLWSLWFIVYYVLFLRRWSFASGASFGNKDFTMAITVFQLRRAFDRQSVIRSSLARDEKEELNEMEVNIERDMIEDVFGKIRGRMTP